MLSQSDIIKMIILIVWIAATVGIIAGYSIRYFWNDSKSIGAEESYYRGIYDVCHSIVQLPAKQCMDELVSQAASKDWFNQDSDGWEWSK